MESGQISVEIVELPLENPASESPTKDGTGDNSEVVRCSSNASLQCTQRPLWRHSSLLKVKTKSRMIDHTVGNFVEEEEEQDQHIDLEDIKRFMGEYKAQKTMSLFEKGSESKGISKSAIENWVVKAFEERRALSWTLNDIETVVETLHWVANVFVIIIIVVVSLLILGIITEKVLIMVGAQVLLLAFKFGDTLFFIFITHAYDVGDRCQIDDNQVS
ncbi:hypothetical protein SLEP1_g2882 [Rubroshorea leprosula]|uniref:Uncharacterized protein n=1 Tax=Rubroshorea leprosula TaxID=152421 RepID=A0AAV5HUF4_9ROSI|nr:hypothetical protein SLEP1_g2882 [Rubroshorea leprosula]